MNCIKTFIKFLTLSILINLLFSFNPAGSAPTPHTIKKSRTATLKGQGKKKQKNKKANNKKKSKKPADKVTVWLRIGRVVPHGVEIVVMPGQRLTDIAKTYGVAKEKIIDANKNINLNLIKAGDRILIPGAKSLKAIKTRLPVDKIDELSKYGVKISTKEKEVQKKKSDAMVLIKSGRLTPNGVVHTVQKGQSLHLIADSYGVSLKAIVKVNKLKTINVIKPGDKILIPGAKKVIAVPGIKSPSSSIVHTQPKSHVFKLKTGKVVKAGVVHTVMPGQSILTIAKAYGVNFEQILKANKIKNRHTIKAGQKILIPGAKKVVAVKCSSSASFYHPVTFHRIHTGETRKLRLFTASGKINKKARKILEKMMFDHRTGKVHKIHPRLIYLLGKVATHFSYRTIIIYSGFRSYRKDQYTTNSKHNRGRAIDFAIDGISNWTLMNYCRKFKNVGIGYYPNSYFVHMDVRDHSAFWIDYSEPGEKPRYGKIRKGLAKKARKGAITVSKEPPDLEEEIQH